MNTDITLKSLGVGPKSILTIDGDDISSRVMGLNLSIDPRSHEHRLELYLVPGLLDVELRDVGVLIDADTHDLLVRLGWTPPAEQEATG